MSEPFPIQTSDLPHDFPAKKIQEISPIQIL
jgi:hypothetical protein